MKKNYGCMLTCIFFLLFSCKKSSTETPAVTTDLIKVKEYKTNVPLPGVNIRLYRCSKYDYVFGCQSTALFATHTTDNKGEYALTKSELNKADEGIVLSKSEYWNRKGGTGENPMEPEAWVKIALKASKAYPDSSIFVIQTIGEIGGGASQSLKAPKDSIINFRLIGNEINKVTWVLYTKYSCIYYCSGDTLAFGSLSLNPQKFETLTSSIIY